MSERKKLVCVLCGTPWQSPRNICVNKECGGLCSWGEAKDGEPSSWVKTPKGYIPRMPTEERSYPGQQMKFSFIDGGTF